MEYFFFSLIPFIHWPQTRSIRTSISWLEYNTPRLLFSIPKQRIKRYVKIYWRPKIYFHWSFTMWIKPFKDCKSNSIIMLVSETRCAIYIIKYFHLSETKNIFFLNARCVTHTKMIHLFLNFLNYNIIFYNAFVYVWFKTYLILEYHIHIFPN